MNETQLQAQFNVLVEQRNNALNQVVNLSGELAVARQTIRELQAPEQDRSGVENDAPTD